MKLLGISGALRRESTNTKLIREAARLFEPSEFRLADLRLPLYDGDLEEESQKNGGLPAPIVKLCEDIAWADAVVFSTPEYNKAPPGVFKNALDWVSRAKPQPLIDKPVAVLSASAGGAGGQRAKSTAYLNLIPFKVRLITDPEVNLGGSMNKFDDSGRLTDEMAEKLTGELMAALKQAVAA
ncbi:MAG: NAD(P)H-dependent oxidoreductase [Pseudomonadota bacterium]